MLRLISGATVALVSLVAGAAYADSKVTIETRVPGQGDSINEDAQPVVIQNRHRLLRVMEPPSLEPLPPAVNSNVIYLNNCKPNGCIIAPGNTSSLDNGTVQGHWGINQQRTLAAWNQSDALWNDVVTCVKDVFSPFGVTITTTNPVAAPHFEIMIAGISTQIGLDANYLGVSPGTCSEYISNSLVFDFANSPSYAGALEDICATAAQEIAHSFALDHVIDSSDPLTYFQYSGRKRFKNAEVQCGSDCVNGISPSNQQCTGGASQQHECICGGNTQNSFQTIKDLFGAGTPTPPTVTFINPKSGAAVAPGFGFSADATDDNGIAQVQGLVDGANSGISFSKPYAFNAPTNLANGAHTVEVIATDIYGATASASVDVVIGDPCDKPSDCATDTETCISGHCVTGPGVQGGLGGACTGGADCASGICGTVNDGMVCLEKCPDGQCPDGFGCQPAGDVSYCVADSGGGGGCSTSNEGTGPLCGLLFGAFVLVRRRRRA